jgi:hypothetical protein
VDGRHGLLRPELIPLTKNLTRVPDVYPAPRALLSAGTVYVLKDEGSGLTPQLPGGKQALLITIGGQREVRTIATPVVGLDAEATYLDESDYIGLGNPGEPRLRLYGWRDTCNKMFGRQGAMLLASTLAGFLAAAAGLYFAIWGAHPTGAATVADRAQTALEWVEEPVDRFNAQSPGVAAARRTVHLREVQASRCLDKLGAREAPAATVPGVNCNVESPPWYRSQDSAAWVTLAVGLLTALVAILGLRDKFGFQKNPVGG